MDHSLEQSDGTAWRGPDYVPHRIGPYLVLEPLGRGGMGVVYRAQHAETGEQVALKTIRWPSQNLLQSLRSEIRALASLRHPGIVRIVAEGVEEGVPWYAMDLIQGVTLPDFVMVPPSGPIESSETRTHTPGNSTRWWTQSLAEGTRVTLPTAPANERARPETPRFAAKIRLPAARGRLVETLTITRRLCLSLAFVHGEGLVHRDLKPQNILVQPDGTPVLVDFGLALRFSGPLGREALHRADMAGTVLYMSPEQARGESVDARADLYSLGCILYELLAGRPPLRGDSVFETVRLHQIAEPQSLASLVSGVPDELERLVMKLLAKQPQTRIGHADDVAALLERLGAEPGPEASWPRARAYLYRPRFVGRGDVLGELIQAADRADTGLGSMTLLGGESGCGKTRLATELAREAQQRGFEVLIGEGIPAQVVARPPELAPDRSTSVSVSPVSLESARAPHSVADRSPSSTGAGGPLETLRRPLQALADRCRERGPAETQRWFGPRARLLAPYEPSLLELPGTDPHTEPEALPADAARQRLFSALAETFASGSDGPAILLILDDLQWADELTLAFLEFLGRSTHLANGRLLVIAIYRTEEVAPDFERLLRLTGVPRFQLDRLGAAEVTTVIGDMLGMVPAPRVLSEHLERLSEGNPLFLAEYLRAAVTEGYLYRDAWGHWQVGAASDDDATPRDYDALPLPGSLRQILERRLDGLSETAVRFVEAAAVLGRELERGLVLQVLDWDELRLVEPLVELRRRQILEETKSGSLRFTHEKLRETAYRRVSGAKLRELHRAAAGALEVLADRARAEALAVHWEAAGEAARARTVYLEAARLARARFAHDAAERCFRACLRLTPVGSVEQVEVRNEMAQTVLQARGRYRDAEAELELALAEARELRTHAHQIPVLQNLATVRRLMGRYTEAVSVGSEALGLARSAGDLLAEGRLLADLATADLFQGRMREARERLDESLTILRRLGNTEAEMQTLMTVGLLESQAGHAVEALAAYEQTLPYFRAHGPRRAEGRILGAIASLRDELGHVEQAQDLKQQALSLAREIGDRGLEALAMGNLAHSERLAGRLEQAEKLLRQALAIRRELGARRLEGHSLMNLAFVVLEQGQLQEARALTEQAEVLAKAIGERRLEGLIHILNAEQKRFEGDLAGAGEDLDRAEAVFDGVNDPRGQLTQLYHRGLLWLAQGRSARLILDRAEALASSSSIGPHSELGREVASLRRAQEAFEAGEPERLFRGQLMEDIPPGLRRWALEAGHLGPPAADQ